MRILIISDLYPPVAFGGYENECEMVARYLAGAHEVRVLTSDKDRWRAPARPEVLRELPSTWGGRTQGVIRAPLAAAGAARVTRRVLAEYQPDLVYAWGMQTVPHATLAAVSESGIPTAYRFCVPPSPLVYDGDRFMRYLGPAARRRGGPLGVLMRGLNRLPGLSLSADRPVRAAISWVSDGQRDGGELSPAVQPVLQRTVWPAIEDAGGLAHLPRLPSPGPTVAYVGRVRPEKGTEVAYRAFAALLADNDLDAQLVVVGWCSSSMRRHLDGVARRFGLAGRVSLRGFVPLEERDALYQSAHVLLVPSLVREGLPLVCLEGALARVPMVAARVGGIPEALRDGQDALLFEPGDVDGCAGALAEVLGNPKATNERVQSAYRHVQESFSLDGYTRATDAFLRDTLIAWGNTSAAEPKRD